MKRMVTSIRASAAARSSWPSEDSPDRSFDAMWDPSITYPMNMEERKRLNAQSAVFFSLIQCRLIFQ